MDVKQYTPEQKLGERRNQQETKYFLELGGNESTE